MKKITIKINEYNLGSIDVALKEANEYLNNPNPNKEYKNLTITDNDIKPMLFADFVKYYINKHKLV